jgi:hypothetical protein
MHSPRPPRCRRLLIRRVAGLAFLSPLVLFSTAPPASPWGGFRGVAGIKITDTHQQILRAAYALLMSDPRIRGLQGIPAPGGRIVPVESILQFEGVDGNPRTLTPYGPGPDAEGSTLYSCHWFNPATGKGLGPQSAADWYQRFLQSLLGLSGGDEELCKGLAWSAHFLADMFVPYHLVGMPAAEALARIAAGNFVLGPSEAAAGARRSPDRGLLRPVFARRSEPVAHGL